jgi:ATP-binding cassette subfamily B protein
VNPATIVLRLIRLSPSAFLRNTTFAVISYTATPVLLGLAAESFFNALTNGKRFDAWGAIALLTFVPIAQQIAGPALGAAWSPLQQRAAMLLRANTFKAMLQSYGHHGLPVGPAEVVSRMRDDPILIADTLDAVSDLIGRSLFAIGAAILMWHVSPLITLSLFVPLLGCSLIVEFLDNRIVTYRNASRQATGVVTGFLGDMFSGQLALRVAGATPFAIERLRQLGEERRHAEVRDAVFAGMVDAFNNNLASVGVGIVLLLSVPAMRSHSFTVGDLALFAVFLDALGWYPAEVGRLLGDLKRIDVSVDRMLAISPGTSRQSLVEIGTRPLAEPVHDVQVTPSPRERLERLEIVGLTYDHPGDDRGIRDISFSVDRGTLTVITGRVGSGKSTLLRVLLGLVPRDAGEIYWNGERIANPSDFFVPPRVAYTAQVPRLFSETLRENIEMGWPSDERNLASAIHVAVLEPDIATLDQALDSLVGPKGVKLSGGQVQRAAAARMFLRRPELIVFDDISSALDAETESELWKRILDHGRDQAFLVVSHRPEPLRRADQVLILDHGRLVKSA